MSILKVDNLKVYYETSRGVSQAVDGISFELNESQSIGLVGESGCGKSTTVKGIVQVMPKNAFIPEGKVFYNETNLLNLTEKQLKKIRWTDIAMVPQAAMDSLNPVYTVKNQFLEVLKLKGKKNKKDAIKIAGDLFEKVGLSTKLLNYYPHQFSGGMKQRAVIALALALNPSLIITDEPVTALDVIVQHQILQELKSLREEMNIALVMITHDISVVAQTCDYIVVMYAGKIVEKGTANQVLKDPLHPYTMGLENSFPDINKPEKELISIVGSPPELINPPIGCRFAERCPFVEEICFQEEPELVELKTGHFSACIHTNNIERLRARSKEVQTWQKKSM